MAGFAAVGADISNYNPPYLYLMAAATYLPLSEDRCHQADLDGLRCAAGGVRGTDRPAALPAARSLPLVCFAVVLFAPTVVVNSSAWGQCDSIYAAFCLGSLYFLLRNKPWWACVFFGVALSFKLQAIFFLPVLIIVLVVNRQRLLALLAVPATFAVMLCRPSSPAGTEQPADDLSQPGQHRRHGDRWGGFRGGSGRRVRAPANSRSAAAARRVSPRAGAVDSAGPAVPAMV